MPNDSTLPEFIAPEKTLIKKIEGLLNNLNNTLEEFPIRDGFDIATNDRVRIRRILFDAQKNLTTEARKYPDERTKHNVLLRYYLNIKQFVQMAGEMETLFRQTLINCTPTKTGSAEDLAMLLETESEKSLTTLFSEFTALDYQNNILADHTHMLDHIEHLGKVSGVIYESTNKLLNKRTGKPIFIIRFFDARRFIADAIEKIHNIIHHKNEQENETDQSRPSHADNHKTVRLAPRVRARSEHETSEEECCYDFGLIMTCHEMKNAMDALLRENNAAQSKRVDMLAKISFLRGKEPESDSDDSSSCSSSDTTSSDSSLTESCSNSRSSSVSSSASSGFFATVVKSRSVSCENAHRARGPT